MFINFSNHPYALWSAEQQAAAQRYGPVVDLAFPAIDPAADEAALDSLATVYADHILHLNPDAVLCQGECTFVYRVVQRLESAASSPLQASAAMARPELPGAAVHHSVARSSISVGGSHPLFQPPAKNALLFFVWLWYIGLGIVKAALKSSIFLFFLEQLCYFNLSPQGDGNVLRCFL